MFGLVLSALVVLANVPFLPDDSPPAPANVLPKELENMKVTEKLETRVPLDLSFFDEDGKKVTLRQALGDGLPVILTFNYANCPMLCSVQLGGLVDVLKKMDWHAGKQFNIVTIGLDPRQTPARTRETKGHYLERYNVDTAARGWRFLSGTEQTVRALADAVGYGYQFLPDKNEYAHPAAMVILSPSGVITSYQYGVAFEPAVMKKVLEDAVVGRPNESPEKFLLACFHYNPKGNSGAVRQIMRAGGIVFVLVLGGALYWLYQRSQSARTRKQTEWKC
jgi:protein SCO1/2